MKNSSKIRFLVLALTLTMILSLVACGKSRTSIVGTWSSDDGYVLWKMWSAKSGKCDLLQRVWGTA